MFGIYTISFSTGAKTADDFPLLIERGDLVDVEIAEMRNAVAIKLLRFDSARTTELWASLFCFPDIAASLAGNEHFFTL